MDILDIIIYIIIFIIGIVIGIIWNFYTTKHVFEKSGEIEIWNKVIYPHEENEDD